MYLNFMDYRDFFSDDGSLSLEKRMGYLDLERLKIYNYCGKYMP